MFEPPTLHFLHIPKTAGTSVTQFLQRQYDLEQIVFETTWRELFCYRPRMPRLRLFRGHFGINLAKMIGPGFNTMTFLRDPVARVVSQYQHIRETPTEGLHKFASQMELAEFFHHRQGRKLGRNLQTRYLGMDLEVGQIWAHTGLINLPPDRFFDDLASPRLLEAARRNLDTFFFVGLTEYYDVSMLLLCHKLAALPETDAVRRRARGTRPDSLPAALRAHLEQENQLDLALYESGKSRLIRDLAETFAMPEILQMPPDAALEHVNERKDELLAACLSRYAERMRKQQQREWHWDASQAFQATGWSDVHGRLSDTPHRWSGPKLVSTVDAPVDPRLDYEVSIRIKRFMIPQIQRQFELRTVDGPVGLHKHNRGGEIEYRGIIPGRDVDDPFLRLSFHVPETVSMAELGLDPNDTDKRGFALRSISLIPRQKQSQ